MSVAEKMQKLRGSPAYVVRDDLERILPQIVALIEAAQDPANEIVTDELLPGDDDWRPRFPKLVEAFEALDRALS